MSNNCEKSNSFSKAYTYDFDKLGYIGPRSQYDIELRNTWSNKYDSNYCNASHNNSINNNVSMSSPMMSQQMMRTEYDNNITNMFLPNMDSCGVNSGKLQNISYSIPDNTYQGFRTGYDLNMQQQWNNNLSSCIAENFSYGLSFNDQNNIYSYSGNMNCESSCSSCNSYPIPVSSCGSNFDIVKIDNCNNNDNDNTKPVNNCNGYMFK